ncbi:DUF6412 domain-containing protein [Nocardiopsis sp. YSL2]|uniref:DUF6412 domain-containing protein n=1 Tax=Nocardiopsis sp. YSL2 TaxID=2939492 RepID=UPI0026F44CAE|nr:DUF6412 domain-containing protein [Nocardiopsis sp. YSL2]
MTLLLAFAEFLLLGVLPTELVATPSSLGPLVLALGAALAWSVLFGVRSLPTGDTATGTGHAMRRRSLRLPVLTLRDPDAAGRPRPRAPGAA